jgi:Domain of unknown function (DUF4129)
VLSPRTFTLFVLLLCMELIGGFVLLVGLSIFDVSALGYGTFWLALLVGIAGVATAVAVVSWAPRSPWDRRIPIGVGLLAVGMPAVVTSPDAVSGLVDAALFAVAFWRGISVTREPPSHTEVERRFGFGFALFFVGIVGVVGRGMVSDRWTWQLIALAGLAYVIVSLIALGVARIEHQREPGALGAVVLAVGAQLGLLVLLGLGALQLFSLDMFGWFGHLTQPFFNVVGATLYHLVTPFASVIDNLFNLIRGHAHHSGAQVAPYQPQDNSHVKKPKERPKQHIDGTPYAIGGLVVMIILLVVIGYLVWRSVPRRTTEEDGARPYTERRETSLSPAELWSIVLMYLRSLFRRTISAANDAATTVRRRVWGGPYPEDPVRKAYVQLLRRTEEAGLPRAATITPVEFQATMIRRWAEGASDFQQITTAYIERRYGDQTLAPEEVSRVQASWQNVRRLIRIPRTDVAAGESDGTPPDLADQSRLNRLGTWLKDRL